MIIRMLVSTRGRYGVRALHELARSHGRGPVSLKEIARRQGLSEHYLEQLMGALRRAGLVRSVRGAHGGYLLGREPSDISVGDVLRVLDGPLVPSDCAGHDEAVTHCGRVEGCVARDIWVKIHDSIRQVVDSITLDDLGPGEDCTVAETVAHEGKNRS